MKAHAGDGDGDGDGKIRCGRDVGFVLCYAMLTVERLLRTTTLRKLKTAVLRDYCDCDRFLQGLRVRAVFCVNGWNHSEVSLQTPVLPFLYLVLNDTARTFLSCFSLAGSISKSNIQLKT